LAIFNHSIYDSGYHRKESTFIAIAGLKSTAQFLIDNQCPSTAIKVALRENLQGVIKGLKNLQGVKGAILGGLCWTSKSLIANVGLKAEA
jgi:hypothetical protein